MPLTAYEEREMLRKIDVMYERSEKADQALFGTDSKNGLLIDVAGLKSKLRFIQWAGGAGTVFLVGLIAHALHIMP